MSDFHWFVLIIGYSNAHYGHPRNLIKAGRGVNMGDGWETARRLDRPEIIDTNIDGTLKVPGKLSQHLSLISLINNN